MVKPQKVFQIELNDEKAVYSPGAIVGGKVKCEFVKQKKISGLTLFLHGECRVKFGKPQKKNDPLSNGETYFYERFDLLPIADKKTFTITPGRHAYEFNVQLPENLPTSFEGQYGYVRYYIRVAMRSENFKKTTSVIVLPFTVILPLDLNCDMESKQTYQGEAYKSIGPCCCPFGKITFLAQLSNIGYVPGYDIPIGVEIQNRANRKVQWLKYTLRQINTYNLQKPQLPADAQTRTETIVLAEARCKGIKPKRTEVIHRGITIPPVPPSNLQFCRLISVKYSLEILAKIEGGCMSAPEYVELPSTPIVIGTVPLQGTTGGRTATAEPSAPPPDATLVRTEGAGDASAPPLPFEPPPSYMESILGAHQITVTVEENDLYPNLSGAPHQQHPTATQGVNAAAPQVMFNPDTSTCSASAGQQADAPDDTTALLKTPLAPSTSSGANQQGESSHDPAASSIEPSAPPPPPQDEPDGALSGGEQEQAVSSQLQVLFAPKYSFYRRDRPNLSGPGGDGDEMTGRGGRTSRDSSPLHSNTDGMKTL